MRTLALQAPAMRWQLELRLVSGCSGHADQNRPSASTAGSCICLSNCMSLAAHRHLLHALCWLAWCSRQTSKVGGRDRRRTRLMQGCWGRHRCTCCLLIRATCMHRVHHMQGGADDGTGLLIAALAASILHADRPWQRGPWRCKHAASANALVAMHSRPADVLPMQLQVRCIHCHRHRCSRTNRRTKDCRYERRY